MANYNDWYLTVLYTRKSGIKRYCFEISVKGTTRAYITSRNSYISSKGAVAGAELVARKMGIELNKDYRIYQ
jgi:hypothetical protein